MKKRRMRLLALLIAIAILATIQNVAAAPVGAFVAKGTVQYESGATCPYGWNLEIENLDQDLEGEPWLETTAWTYPGYDYFIAGATVADSDRIKVTVTSPDGSYSGTNTLVASEAWDGTNVIINVTVYEVPIETETFTKSLVSGWNLISLPLTPTDNSTSEVLGNDTIAYDAVYRYDATSKQFVDVATGTMDPGIGYFVHVTTVGTWEYEGTTYTSITASLSQGLNCVGWVNETGSALSGALSSIDGDYRYVARWDASSQSYEVYMPGAPAVFNDFTTMERGEGYFIAATSSCMLTYPYS